VDPDLVTGFRHRFHLARKGLDRMSGDKPRRFDAEPAKQLQQTWRADLAGEQSARNVVG
jgi:hypothetical protein